MSLMERTRRSRFNVPTERILALQCRCGRKTLQRAREWLYISIEKLSKSEARVNNQSSDERPVSLSSLARRGTISSVPAACRLTHARLGSIKDQWKFSMKRGRENEFRGPRRRRSHFARRGNRSPMPPASKRVPRGSRAATRRDTARRAFFHFAIRAACNSANIRTNFARTAWPCASSAWPRLLKATSPSRLRSSILIRAARSRRTRLAMANATRGHSRALGKLASSFAPRSNRSCFHACDLLP